MHFYYAFINVPNFPAGGKIWTAEWLILKIHYSILQLALKTKVLPNISRISKCMKKVDKPSLEALDR